jgi:hypothetical protein
MTTGYAIDLSHHQAPASVPWKGLLGKVDVVMVRLAYGAALRDETAAAHIKGARSIAATVGGYQFYRPTQSVDAHFNTLLATIESAGLGAGDVVPALDIEPDTYPTKQPPNPSWAEPCEELVGRIVDHFGDCLVYTTRAYWVQMGSPSWLLERPLWVAHWGVAKPASPGGVEPALWQHRVAAFDPSGPSEYREPTAEHPFLQLDQSRVLKELPRIRYTEPPADIDVAHIEELNAMSLAAQAREAVHGSFDPRRINYRDRDDADALQDVEVLEPRRLS